jgi:hypothetical protein
MTDYSMNREEALQSLHLIVSKLDQHVALVKRYLDAGVRADDLMFSEEEHLSRRMLWFIRESEL